MSSCLTTPTLTRTDTLTTSNVVTTSTPSTSTQPPTVTTITPVCPPGATCTFTGPIISTIAGSTTVVEVPVTTTVEITSISVTTFFETSCTPISAGGGISATPPSTTSSSSRPTASATSSSLSAQTTIASLSVSASSSTLADGSVVVQSVTVTQSPPARSSGVGGTSSSSTNVGAIVGGVVGGVVGLILLVLLVWYLKRRRDRLNDMFEHDEAIAGTRDRHSMHAPINFDPGRGLSGQIENRFARDSDSAPLSPTQAGAGLSAASAGGHQRSGSVVSGNGSNSHVIVPGPSTAMASSIPTGPSVSPQPEAAYPSPTSFPTTSSMAADSAAPPSGSELQRDGKGRLTSDAKNVVHLDGSRYQDGNQGASSSAPAPPPYST